MPPDFIPVLGENPMEAIDQGATTTSQVGDNVVVESGVPYSSHSPPLVQQPSRGNSSFHSPLEGHVDDTTHRSILLIMKKNAGNIVLLFFVHRR